MAKYYYMSTLKIIMENDKSVESKNKWKKKLEERDGDSCKSEYIVVAFDWILLKFVEI